MSLVLNKSMFNFTIILKKLAEKSPCRKKFAAIVVYRNKIIGKGYNYEIGKFSVHAEEAALASVRHRDVLKNSYLILGRILNGKFIQCLCCTRCQHWIHIHGIRQIKYYY